MTKKQEPAGIEYGGIAGGSKDCQTAVERLIQFGEEITIARILTWSNQHCLLLTNTSGDSIAIKSGFTSGYSGEGPRRFSYVLQMLRTFGIAIEEYQVDKHLLTRLDTSALTLSDLDRLEKSPPIRPSRWGDYISERHFKCGREGVLLRELPPIVPLASIDPRIVDLAITFWENPDERLLTAYRRLEDAVRKRTGTIEHGSKLFSKVFNGSNPSLTWENIDEGEKQGRVCLFTGAYMAHRNPRAHRELRSERSLQLSEFLVLNHLYLLEAQSTSPVGQPVGRISAA